MSIEPDPYTRSIFFVEATCQSEPYFVDLEGQERSEDNPVPWCGCKGYEIHHHCKHISAVQEYNKLRVSL